MPEFKMLLGNLNGNYDFVTVQGQRVELVKEPDAQVACIMYENNYHIIELSTGMMLTFLGRDYANTPDQAKRNAYINLTNHKHENCPFTTLVMRAWALLSQRGVKCPVNKFEVIKVEDWDE